MFVAIEYPIIAIDPDISCFDQQRRALVVSCGDTSERLELGEEILDRVSGFVHVLVMGARLFPIFLWRYDALNARLFQRIENPFLRVIGFVGQKGLNVFEKIGRQGIGSFESVSLSRRQMNSGRVAQSIA